MSALLNRRNLFAAAALALALPSAAVAQDWALDGYDPVALLHGQQIPGSAAIVTRWQGKIWHFSNEANRTSFEENPRAYVPGFDGLCPVALEDGRPARGDAQQFVVIGERIYLTGSPRARAALMADPRGVLMGAKQRFLAMGR